MLPPPTGKVKDRDFVSQTDKECNRCMCAAIKGLCGLFKLFGSDTNKMRVFFFFFLKKVGLVCHSLKGIKDSMSQRNSPHLTIRWSIIIHS